MMTGGETLQEGRSEEEILRERAVRLAQPTEEEEHADKTQLLVLRFADEWYGVEVEHVREILHDVEITRVPCTPSYVMGILSVRGEIISVCNLKQKLGLAVDFSVAQPPIVVVETGDMVTGLASDDVIGIVEVPSTSVEPALATIDRRAADYISGETTVDGKLVAILDLEHVIQKEEG